MRPDGATLTITDGEPPRRFGRAAGDPLRPRDAARYTALAEHARGARGRVIRARDNDLGREVAIKELLGRGANAEHRFVREATLTARLEHPGIVPVHDAGRFADGTPFYAMKLVSGRPLSELIAGAPDLPSRLALVGHAIAVADAMAYAHDRGVIHRDLKPSNVVIGDFGETVVVDWGLAKELGASEPQPEAEGPYRSDRSPTATVVGAIVGTPAFMAPEQARGECVDGRADVYAIGAILYAVIAGHPPYRGVAARDIVAAVRRGPPPSLIECEPRTPAELGAIVARAMAREPAERYATPAALASDLRRLQAGQLVWAHRYSWLGQLARAVRRHRTVTIAALLLAVVGLLSLERIVRSEREAQRARSVAEARAESMILLQAETALERDPTRALAWLAQYPRTGDRAEAQRIVAEAEGVGVARHVLPLSGPLRALAFAARGRALISASWYDPIGIWDPVDGVREAALGGVGASSPLTSEVGDRVVALGPHHRVVTRDERGELRARPECPPSTLALALAANGERLACAVGGAQVVVASFTGAGVVEVGVAEVPALDRLALSPDGRYLFAAGGLDVARVDLVSGGRRSARLPFPVDDLWPGPGGELAAAGEGGVMSWPSTGAPVTLAPGPLLAAGHVGGWIVVARDRVVERLALASSGPVERLPITARPHSVAISPDGTRIAAGTQDGMVHLWDLPSGGREQRLTGHRGSVRFLSFSADGGWLASGGADRTIRLWRLARPAGRRLPHGPPLSSSAISPDGRWAAGITLDGAAWLWSLEDGVSRRLVAGTGDAKIVAFAAGVQEVAVGTDRGVFRCRLPDARCVPEAGVAVRPLALAYAPEGNALAAAGADGVIRISGRPLGGPGALSWTLAFTGADRLVVGQSDGGVIGWDVVAERSRRLRPAGTPILGLGQLPGGFWIHDGESVEVRAADGELRERRGFADRISRVATDGTWIAVGDTVGQIHVWRPGDSAPARWRAHGELVAALCLVGDRVISGGLDGSVAVGRVGGPAFARVFQQGMGNLLRSGACAPMGRFVLAGEAGLEVFDSVDGFGSPTEDPWARAASLTSFEVER